MSRGGPLFLENFPRKVRRVLARYFPGPFTRPWEATPDLVGPAAPRCPARLGGSFPGSIPCGRELQHPGLHRSLEGRPQW